MLEGMGFQWIVLYSYHALQHIAFDRQQPCQHKLCEDFEMGEINHKQNIYIDF